MVSKLTLLSFLLFIGCCNTFLVHPKCLKEAHGVQSTALKAATVQDTELVEEFLNKVRSVGPLGSSLEESEQKGIVEMAKNLPSLPNMANYPLEASTNYLLVYSDSSGSSSGKLWGPIAGDVSQIIVDDSAFINQVSLGPLQIALRASRKTRDDVNIQVFFHELTIRLFGNTIQQKSLEGGGNWKMLYVGKVQGKTLRVMETPSLFVLLEE